MKKVLGIVVIIGVMFSMICFASEGAFLVENDGTGYTSIAQAVTEAESGDTLKLLNNVNIGTDILTINKSLTLNLNNFTLTGSNTSGRPSPVISVNNAAATLTIQDTSDGGQGKIYYNAGSAQGRTIDIVNGTVILKSGTIESIKLVSVYVKAGGTFIMEGGNVKYTGTTNAGFGVWVKGTFEMKNGTVNGGLGKGVSLDNNAVSFIMRNGTVSGERMAISGAVEEAPVCKVLGGTVNGMVELRTEGGSLLQTSINSATNGEQLTIQMSDDLNMPQFSLVIPDGKDIVVDLNGNTINLNQVYLYGKLKIIDSAEGGKIVGAGKEVVILKKSTSEFRLEGGTITNTSDSETVTAINASAGMAYHTGGTIVGKTAGNVIGTSIIQTALDNDEESVKLTGDLDISKYRIIIPAGKTFTINMNSKTLNVSNIMNYGTLNLIGKGTIISGSSQAITSLSDSSINIKNVNIQGTDVGVYLMKTQSATIEGCNVTVTSTSTSTAGINVNGITGQLITATIKDSTVQGLTGIKATKSTLNITGTSITNCNKGIDITGADTIINLLGNDNKIIATEGTSKAYAISLSTSFPENICINVDGGILYGRTKFAYLKKNTVFTINGGYFGDATSEVQSPETYTYVVIADGVNVNKGSWDFDDITCTYFAGIVDFIQTENNVVLDENLFSEDDIVIVTAVAENVNIDLANAMSNIVTDEDISDIEAIETKFERAGITVGDDNIEVVVDAFVVVEVADYDPESNKITLDITPKYVIKATLDKGNMEDGVNTVTLQSEKVLRVTEPIEITFQVPEGFSTDNLFIRHTKSASQIYYYETTVDGRNVTFINPNGFSDFSTLNDGRTGVIKYLPEEADSFERTYTTSSLGTELPTQTKRGYSFSGWSIGGTTYKKLTEELLTAIDVAEEPVEATPVFKKTSGGGGGGSGKTTLPVVKEKVDITWTNSSEWSKAELEIAKAKDLIPNMLDKKDMTEEITRLEFAAVCVKLYERITGSAAVASTTNPFTDCNDEEMLKAYKLGITDGVSPEEFLPNRKITREEMSTMMTRTIEKAGINVAMTTKDIKFADENELSDWAVDGVHFMATNELIKGKGDNKFAPKDNAKREEALAIAQRTVSVFEK